MAEIWGAAIAAAGAIASGVAASKKAKADRKAASADQKAATKDEAIYGSILSQFEAEQEDYYNQLGRQRKQRGLDQFREFSTVSSFAPSYSGDNNRIVLPDRPDIQNLIAQGTGQTEVDANGNPKNGGVFAKLDNAENKVRRVLDPIGAKISRKDPVRKALKKLF